MFLSQLAYLSPAWLFFILSGDFSVKTPVKQKRGTDHNV
ncbi:hypothetical protein VAE308_1050189 [Vibrio aestuarianus]|uniref:Uncharacterized protein n=1 Tax=Vibrio aestuarianus TaxID=28171 RepID=A0ABM9FPH0_9VIBR|nr:hypothetical protein VAE308_1050189 [Vibrio aestuarianus]CAH8224687.1 hypothetical protein VAE063_940190 [Vibrio aestuarianus]